MKHKPAARNESLNCGLCNFTPVSKVKIIKHMKSNHTKQNDVPCSINNAKQPEKIMAEDMSLCVVRDDEESGVKMIEKLLAEKITCI